MAEPPTEIKTTIEKTVAYVKKNGVTFEQKLLQNDPDGKFSFLKSSDPYNSFYKALLDGEIVATGESNDGKNDEKKAIKEPSPLLFITDTPPLSTHDLDVIKLTAQYFACNSPKHTDALQRYMDKKGYRSQFAFLNRGHSLHTVYKSYCRQYRAIIEASKGDKDDKSAAYIDQLIHSTPQKMYQKAYERAVYEKKNKIDKKAKESETRKAQLQYALIDWQDFTFVAKINFDAVDEVSELAVPLKREEVMYRALLAKSKELQLQVSQPKVIEKEEKVDKEEENSDKKAQSASPAPMAAPKGMKIRAAGESRLKRKNQDTLTDGERSIQCPITGQHIPELKFDNHLKVLLRDPRYKEQQDNFVKKNFTYSSNLTAGQVYENIKRLVKKRSLSEEEEQHTKRVDIGPQA